MKKILISGFCISATLCFSQENRWTKGITGSANLSYIRPAMFNDKKTGFSIGGFANYKISNKFSLQPELLYSLKRSDIYHNLSIGDDNSGYYRYESKFDVTAGTLEIPVMLQYNLWKNLYLEAGPQVAFLLHSKAEDKNLPPEYSMYKNVYKFPNKILFAANFGAGYKFNETWSANFRFRAGINDFITGETSDSFFGSWEINSLSLGIGYRF